MSDRFHPLAADRLARWTATELEEQESVFGIPRELFFVPNPDDRFATSIRGARAETPIGVAAGPHTQLAQNIVAAWLCGARVIELKTVQTLDDIEVNKPCIDMQDAGFNIEWSQELRIRESFSEYLLAWVLIHALHARLGFPGESPGVIFDLSVGYDLAGLSQPNMRWFLEHMSDARGELETCLDGIGATFPEVRDLSIPARLVNSVTLSTLHGCPPEEIGAIAEHLLEAWSLHTAVKLNPTLLGYDTVRGILVDALGWTRVEPHQPAFDADIGYSDALNLLASLRAAGRDHGLEFSVKLCNTLPVVNRQQQFDTGEATAYLSGRPLHALAVELAHRLTEDTDGELGISFAGGADAFNTPDLLAAGLRPVTSCSDLLRPGGYLRLRQYLSEIDRALVGSGAADLDDFILRTDPDGGSVRSAARANLTRYAATLRCDPELQRATYRRDHTKTSRRLGLFDCIQAPCTDACGIDQQVPGYMRRVAAGDLDGASAVISADNPLPSILGRACHHPCEPVCLRTHLDQPVAIREIKRFVTDHAPQPGAEPLDAPERLEVAVVGGGPCGLAAATHLARAGAGVTVFEARREAGGMVSATIPGYRASRAAVDRDLEAVARLGVKLEYGIEVGRDPRLQELFDGGFGAIVIAAGAQRGLRLDLENESAPGVLDGLDFLRAVRRGEAGGLGSRIGVIGGGDVAMDCARSARRLTSGEVEILYRRTIDQMPAHPEEISDLLAEGIGIRELVSPHRIELRSGRLAALWCTEMSLGELDSSGRRGVVEKPGARVAIELDCLIVAIGQRTDLGVFTGLTVATTPSGFVSVDEATMETSTADVYAGGDLVAPGPSNIVDACGDGRRIARAILKRAGIPAAESFDVGDIRADRVELVRRRAQRLARVAIPRAPAENHLGFVEMIETLSPDAAAREASRCLDCDLMCGTCESVCPNRAIISYRNHPWRVTLPGLTGKPGVGTDPEFHSAVFEADQSFQVAVLADYCNECGNCVNFCPTAGRPWRDKPRIYFDRTEFESEQDNAFMLARIDGAPVIEGRFDGQTHRLRVDDTLTYDSPGRRTRLSADDFRVLESTEADGPSDTGPVDLEPCAVMYALLRGLTDSLPHLPGLETANDER